VQYQPQYHSSQSTLSNGWSSNSDLNFNPHFHQNNLPPHPPTLSLDYNPYWQSKRLSPPSRDNNDFRTYYPPTKRPCVQHTSPTNKNNPAPTTESRLKKCSKCGLLRAWELFSKRQWTSCETLRKCKSCVDDTVAANEISSLIATITNPSPSSTTEKDKTKICSSCGERCAWESFSKRQWTSQEDVRKCKPCVDKVLAQDRTTQAADADKLHAANESQPKHPVDTALESAKEKDVSIDENHPGDSLKDVNDDGSESASQSITPLPDAVASKDSQSMIDDKIPLKLCSKCNKELSKSSYTLTQWKKKEGGRRCNCCVSHPTLKVKGGLTTHNHGQMMIHLDTVSSADGIGSSSAGASRQQSSHSPNSIPQLDTNKKSVSASPEVDVKRTPLPPKKYFLHSSLGS